MAFKELSQQETELLSEKEREAYLEEYKIHEARVKFVERLEVLENVKLSPVKLSAKKIHLINKPEAANGLNFKNKAKADMENFIRLGNPAIKEKNRYSAVLNRRPVETVNVKVSDVLIPKTVKAVKISETKISPLTKIHMFGSDLMKNAIAPRKKADVRVNISEKLHICKPSENIPSTLVPVNISDISPVFIPIQDSKKINLQKPDIKISAAKIAKAPFFKNTVLPVSISDVSKITIPHQKPKDISLPENKISGVNTKLCSAPLVCKIEVSDISSVAAESIPKLHIKEISPVRPITAKTDKTGISDIKLKSAPQKINISLPQAKVKLSSGTVINKRNSLNNIVLPEIKAKTTKVSIPDMKNFTIDKESILKTIR